MGKRLTRHEPAIYSEAGLHKPLEKIFRDVFSDDGLVLLQRGIITLALLRGDLEADIQQLAERRVLLVVAQRIGELLGIPAVHDGRRQFLFINVNHVGVGRAEFA